MGRHYTKNDVEVHRLGFSGPSYPAINVKVYTYPDVYDVMNRFNCSEKVAQTALNNAYEALKESFWDNINDVAVEKLGKNVQVFSEGRQGGWLVVVGLMDIKYWDAVDLAKWRSFEKMVKREIDYLSSKEVVFDQIEWNDWA